MITETTFEYWLRHGYTGEDEIELTEDDIEVVYDGHVTGEFPAVDSGSIRYCNVCKHYWKGECGCREDV